MGSVGDILVLPFFGQGHLNPCVELCKNLSSSNCKTILIIPSHLSSSIPSNLHRLHPLVEVQQISESDSPSLARVPPPHRYLAVGIESLLSERYSKVRPGCVIIDVMMSWSKEIFKKANVPVVYLFTSGACATAMEYAAWKAHVDDMAPNETRLLPGLPDCMAFTYSDLKRRNLNVGGGGRRPSGKNFGPPKLGVHPLWLDDAANSTAVLINTCDDLERPFIEYLTVQMGKPVLGVGPLLPEMFWKTDPVLHDADSRPNRKSNYTEDEVIQWLESNPRRSVIYVSFGSEVGPTLEEYKELAEALAESTHPFIWVIQPGAGKSGPNLFSGKPAPDSNNEGYTPTGLEERVGKRGLIIKGWAPQLSILSHPSTGGFLSHCGWNSTVEAIGCGIPILAWPIRGDQYYDAKLIAKYLKAGHLVSSGNELSDTVTKSDIMRGIETLMQDQEVHDRAIKFREIFKGGCLSCSKASLNALIELISK